MKRIIRFLLVVTLFISIGTINVFAETRTGTLDSGISFSYDTATKTLTLSGSTAIKSYNGDGYGMSSDIYAKYKASGGSGSWYVYETEHIVISEGITKIGECAFENWTKLKSVQLPNSMKIIDYKAFYNCYYLNSVNLNNGLTTIESEAFGNCLKLGIVELPSSITKIDKFAFDNAIAVLKHDGSLSIPSDTRALAITSDNISYDENGCLIIDDELVLYNGDFRNVKITDGIKKIGVRAFGMAPSNVLSNTIISIPSSVDEIKDEAFSNYRDPATIKYDGSMSQWDQILVKTGNNIIKKSNVKFRSTKLESDSSIVQGEQIKVTITPCDTFNASYIKLNFDSDKVSFNSAPSGFGYKIDENSVILSCYGQDDLSTISVYFNAISNGEAEFVLETANFGNKVDAEDKDLTVSDVEGASSTTFIRKSIHDVTIDYTLFTGSNNVSDGTIYEFTAKDDTHYTYSTVTATMDSQAVTVNYDSSSKKYSIANVTGDLVITGSRTGNTYAITYSTTTSATLPTTPASARYGETVTFTIPTEENWAYNVTSVTGSLQNNGRSENTYSFVMGENVSVVIDRETRDQSVTVTGNASSSIVLSSSTYVANSDDGYGFVLNKDSAYNFEVSVTVNGVTVTPTVDDNGSTVAYLVQKPAYGGIIITANKSVVNGAITATEFVKFDGKSVYLIKNQIAKFEDNRYFTYDNKDMLWSNEYSAYCYLVVSSTTPNIQDSMFDLKNGTVSEVVYNGDVNGTGYIDSNDAQLVWNIYKPLYSDFTTKVTMEKYLKADVNGDGVINVADAAKILDLAYGIGSSAQ